MSATLPIMAFLPRVAWALPRGLATEMCDRTAPATVQASVALVMLAIAGTMALSLGIIGIY